MSANVLQRNNVTVAGLPDGPTIVFAHGFGCDQHMWRYVVPAFEDTYRIVLFDYVGAGGSDVSAYDDARYGSIDGYALDVIEVLEALEVGDAVFVGHSVSSMVGVRVAVQRPELISKLVLVGPSPRYINEGDYVGGFTAEDIDGLLQSLDSNYLGWSAAMAPVIMANTDRPELGDAVFVGHSVSSMVGVRVAVQRPELISKLVLIGPSPRYINEGDYVGGFTAEDIDGLLQSLDSNYLGWSAAMAPVIMANTDRPELGAELSASFCRTDPEIQKKFARVTFLSDHRADLPEVQVPTLVLQCSDDVIAPDVVGEYVHEQVAGSTFRKLRAVGHCPNLSAPQETVEAIKAFLAP